MPEICGRICPQDRLCEGNCVIEQSGHGTVTIGAVETLSERGGMGERLGEAAEAADGSSMRPLRSSAPDRPALRRAEELRRIGYKVTVYDRHDRAGGLLIYGIPNFKLEKEVVARRVQRLEEGGILFSLNTESAVTSPLESCAPSTMRC